MSVSSKPIACLMAFLAAHCLLTSCQKTLSGPFAPFSSSNILHQVTTNISYRAVFCLAFGVAGASPNLQNPNGIVVVPDATPPIQHIYVSDSFNNNIVHYTFDGIGTVTYQNTVNAGVGPQLMCVNPAGTMLYVLNTSVNLLMFNNIGVMGAPVAAVPASYGFGAGASGLGQLSGFIGGPCITSTGMLFIADRANNRFQSYTNLPGVVQVISTNLSRMINTFAGVAVAAPWIVRLHSDGTLLLSDVGGNRILNTDTNFNLIANIGNATTTPGIFNGIGDITTNGLGQILAVDRGESPRCQAQFIWDPVGIDWRTGICACTRCFLFASRHRLRRFQQDLCDRCQQ